MSKINYLGVSTLKTDIENVKRNFYGLKRVHLCIYNINNIVKTPFLEFMLYKYGDNNKDNYKNTICFPFFYYDIDSGDNIIKIAKNKLKNILSKSKHDFKYNGYVYDDADMYMFFEIGMHEKVIIIGDLKLAVNKFDNNSTYIFGTIHEIINLKMIINYKILDYVINFFYKFPQFIYLYNENMEKYDIPTILYLGDNMETINYRVFMGSSRNSSLAVFGPYYYFSQLNSALRYGVWDQYVKDNAKHYSNKYGKYKNGSLMRYAVFTKKMQVKMNNKTDEEDNSLTTLQMIKESASVAKLKRISDRDGKWTKKYDSIYAGIHDNVFDRGELVAIKDNDNATLLSIHKLDMAKFPDKKEDYTNEILKNVLIE